MPGTTKLHFLKFLTYMYCNFQGQPMTTQEALGWFSADKVLYQQTWPGLRFLLSQWRSLNTASHHDLQWLLLPIMAWRSQLCIACSQGHAILYGPSLTQPFSWLLLWRHATLTNPDGWMNRKKYIYKQWCKVRTWKKSHIEHMPQSERHTLICKKTAMQTIIQGWIFTLSEQMTRNIIQMAQRASKRNLARWNCWQQQLIDWLRWVHLTLTAMPRHKNLSATPKLKYAPMQNWN